MPTLTTGAIKSLKMPEAFSQHEQIIGGFGANNWTHTYRIPGNEFPEISFRYSGYPIYVDDVPSFRDLIAQGPHTVYEQGNPKFSLKTNIDLVKQVSLCLGNSGDNQVANPETAMFNLKKMEVREISGRKVLHVTGWFHTQKMEPVVYMTCIFIDAEPNSSECRIEELYFQAVPLELFDQHLPDFDKLLETVNWVN